VISVTRQIRVLEYSSAYRDAMFFPDMPSPGAGREILERKVELLEIFLFRGPLVFVILISGSSFGPMAHKVFHLRNFTARPRTRKFQAQASFRFPFLMAL